MKTIILPGHSPKNKVWAQKMADQIGFSDYSIIEWEHWKDGSDRPLDFDLEIKKVLEVIGQEKVQILAKSIGSYITARIMALIPEQLDKIALCGIPLNFLQDDKKDYQIFANVPTGKILIIQNVNDPAASYEEVKDFFRKINTSIPIVSKPSDNHHYPYPEDFKKFLLD